jgi:hypothetical protein
MAKYGVTAQNQKPDVNSVARQFCWLNSARKRPLACGRLPQSGVSRV